ncbi:M12 family metallo-peptidase [Flavobacteriales bacterium]|nr:M12 family metallo-peptidase [Flavobacteriales bacterium]
MQKLIFTFFLALGMLQLSAQENVFSYTMTKNIITKNEENTKAFDVNRVLLNQIISENSNEFFFKIPLIDEGFLNINMKQFSVLNPKHNLIIESANGKVKEDYIPDFQSYYILHEGKSIGTFLFFENSIVISYKHNNRQFELNKIDNEFLLFDVNDCLLENTFSCKVEEKMEQINIEENFPESSVMTTKCLELAIEIDQYTRNTFSSNVSTTNWAHAILAGVNQVYFNEVNLNVSIVTTIIWETTDPYASYISDASNMLGALRNHWTANNSSISRDLVHLLTKRSNTGTGGIAYLDVLCNNSWGYGFSASLNNTTNFNFPNPPYTWNLMVCSHEIGHNIGSHHTHWCGWPGGAIDNCTDVEGSCPNNPVAQIGTIMSYCHTTSSGSLIDFHSIVISNALIPEINGASCLTMCAFYGCTDPNALNYDPNVTIDDGSCIYCTTTLPFSEGFNNGIGSWTNTGSAGNWSLNSGGTPSNSTGPSNGNSGAGNYMYVESSSPNYPNVGPFSLTSECFDLSGLTNPSLSFYYNMYGAAMGTLNVYSNSSLVWSLSGNQGQGWNLVQIPLTSAGNTLIIEFEGTTGSSFTSDIAIDDINIIGLQQVNGCTDANAINYNSNATFDDGSCIYPLAVTIIGDNVSCNGANDGSGTVAVSGGQTPFTYSWNTGQTTSFINNLSPGTYTLTVTDASGQTQTNSFTVLEPLPLSLSFIITNESAAGSNDGAIDLTVSGGFAPYVYFWNTSPTQTTEDISGLLAGNYIVFVGYDSWLCFVADTVTVNVIISGCIDSTALNYDPTANVDDGSCVYCVYGCTDSTAVNYAALATCDDGTCIASVYGCTDATACNYDPLATTDDGSCEWTSCIGGICSNDPISGLGVTDVIQNRATFTFDDMNTYDASGAQICRVDQLRIQYKELGTSSWSQKNMGSPTGYDPITGICNSTTNTAKLVLGLTSATTYEWRMKVWYCGVGNSGWVSGPNFTTLGDCPNVGNLTVTSPTTTKATFTWDASNGAYSFVRLQARVDTVGSSFFNIGGVGVNYGSFTKNKNGLVPGESYRAKSRTWCDPNGGAYKAPSWTSFIYWTQPTSIRLEGGSAINNLTVYPNPSRDIFNVSFTSDTKQNLKVRILNVIGEELINENLEQFIGEYTKQINLSENAKGIYFLEIETNDGIINKKLILQ